MSLTRVQIEISRFLRSSTPEVLCISGGWGVGKTFAWKRLLEEERAAGQVALPKYAYVSLFGLENLADLKKAIFHNTVSTNSDERSADADSIAKQVGETIDATKKHIGKIGGFFGSKGAAVAGLIEDLTFAAIKKRLICIDDLERAGAGLEPKDILGLANFLKEERECKVVILLNEEQLAEEGGEQFRSQFEKVVDVGLKFIPDSKDSTGIALNTSVPAEAELAALMEKIGCNNIRLIMRAKRLLEKLHDFELDDHELHQFAHTVAIATFIQFGENEGWSLDQLRTHNSQIPHSDADRRNDELHRFLVSQSYVATDELDLALIDAVENGFVDTEAVAEALDKQREYVRLHGRKNEFSRAWDYYHNNLDHTPEEFVRKLREAIMGHPDAVSLANFNGTLAALDELGHEKDADTISDAYFSARKLSLGELNDDVFLWNSGDGVNRRVLAERDRLAAEFVDERNPSDVIRKMVENSGWNEEDWTLLNGLTEEEIISMLDGLAGDRLSSSLRWLSRFASDEGDQFQPFGSRLLRAAATVAERSPSVRRKLEQEGLLVGYDS